jgi:hypothetical protein
MQQLERVCYLNTARQMRRGIGVARQHEQGDLEGEMRGDHVGASVLIWLAERMKSLLLRLFDRPEL